MGFYLKKIFNEIEVKGWKFLHFEQETNEFQ